jgi:radical SAM protein with 4Fe4S-binding SPASM domain
MEDASDPRARNERVKSDADDEEPELRRLMNRATLSPITAFKAPLYIAWEITHRCNARCLHCYSASGPDSSCADELSTGEALDVIDQLAEAGLLMLAFSGGEPMMRPDWRTLVRHAVESGLGVNVGTNGSTVTARTAGILKSLGIHSVTVSLDSHDPAVHDRFRQSPGLFTRTVAAIRFLVERRVRVVVGFTPTRLNWRDGRGVIGLACQLGADAVNLSEYVPAGRGTIDLALSSRELYQLLQEWIGYRQLYRDRITIVWHDCRVGMLVSEEERRNYVGCGAGRLVARICPDGTVTPCVFLPTPIGSFRTEPFRSMWSRSYLLEKFRERSHISGNCGDCQYLAICGGCRAVAYAYSGGDPLAGDPHCWIEPTLTDRLAGLADGEGLPV